MSEKKLSPFDAISFGFKSLLDHIRLFFLTLVFGSILIGGIVTVVGLLNISILHEIPPQIIEYFRQYSGVVELISIFRSNQLSNFVSLLSTNIIWVIVSGLLLSIIFVGFDLGLKKIALDVHDNKQTSVGVAFSYFHLTPQSIFAWFCYLLMVWIGWLFLIIPGFIALIRFAFFPYFIVDKNMGAFDSLKKSYEITAGQFWELFALWSVIKILVYICSLSWLGVLLTWPISVLSYAYAYRKLTI